MIGRRRKQNIFYKRKVKQSFWVANRHRQTSKVNTRTPRGSLLHLELPQESQMPGTILANSPSWGAKVLFHVNEAANSSPRECGAAPLEGAQSLCNVWQRATRVFSGVYNMTIIEKNNFKLLNARMISSITTTPSSSSSSPTSFLRRCWSSLGARYGRREDTNTASGQRGWRLC